MRTTTKWWLTAAISNAAGLTPELFYGRATDVWTFVGIALLALSAVAAVWSTETRDER